MIVFLLFCTMIFIAIRLAVSLAMFLYLYTAEAAPVGQSAFQYFLAMSGSAIENGVLAVGLILMLACSFTFKCLAKKKVKEWHVASVMSLLSVLYYLNPIFWQCFGDDRLFNAYSYALYVLLTSAAGYAIWRFQYSGHQGQSTNQHGVLRIE